MRQGKGKWARKGPDKPSDEWFLGGLPRDKILLDSDGDGIPDAWVGSYGLDKADPKDYNTIMPSGYTAIEEYINERASVLIRRF